MAGEVGPMKNTYAKEQLKWIVILLQCQKEWAELYQYIQ